MLVRINSSAKGIKNYLETGRKKGREYDRDLIDERIPLAGDILLMDDVIQTIQTKQEGDARYLHITLGFSEQFTTAQHCGPGQINVQRLHEIVDAYRQILMSAYDQSEYLFYAEAHIPKVTHELNASTGDYEARLPHIHVVIPTRNLESDRYLNPFGYLKDMTVPDAIQEYINQRFELRSPKQSRRDPAVPQHPLSRHVPGFEGQSPKQIRAYLVDLVAQGRVRSFEQLIEAGSFIGATTVRQGKDGDYLNVKPDWADKGINIKDLQRAGFETTAQRLREGAGAPEYERLVEQWRAQGAFEARYAQGSPRLRAAYKAMSVEQRTAFLDQAKDATRARLAVYERPIEQQHVDAAGDAIQRAMRRLGERGVSVPRPIGLAARIAQLAKEFGRAEDGRMPVGAGDEARTRPSAQKTQTSEERLQLSADAIERAVSGFNPDKVKAWLSRRNLSHAIERAQHGLAVAQRAWKSRTVIEAIAASAKPIELDPRRLKADTNPAIVLTTAERLYGIRPAEYAVGTGADGTPRIVHKDKQYNLGDFFTKHLEVPWSEAQNVLRDCYRASISDALPPPDKDLWRQFAQWREREYEAIATKRVADGAAFRARVMKTREEYRARKEEAQALPVYARAASVARARADQFVAQQGIAQERSASSAATRLPRRNAHYREFLAGLATNGDVAALTELRRVAPHQREEQSKITGGRSQAGFPLPSYTVDALGSVTYRAGGSAIVRDSAQGVTVLEPEKKAYDAAIRIAAARYGRTLTLNGDREFVLRMTEAARRTGLPLTLLDPSRSKSIPFELNPRDR